MADSDVEGVTSRNRTLRPQITLVCVVGEVLCCALCIVLYCVVQGICQKGHPLRKKKSTKCQKNSLSEPGEAFEGPLLTSKVLLKNNTRNDNPLLDPDFECPKNKTHGFIIEYTLFLMHNKGHARNANTPHHTTPRGNTTQCPIATIFIMSATFLPSLL